ncbi:hypothetical protein [Marinobacter oulmenensis]|uniref:Uncharacterized protein n=1 Tax=Marinobacter oulmenensis TaxID=643747 RepID=A0A840UHA4_9GAMM|nr:hypothetical protein [Marinobacter oulmenensis]MBB5320167.1 hypothetical protein [Marinobacter oulmenensis]
MDFEQTLYEWINKSLVNGVPSQVKAFSFNLYETGSNFGIELIGASEFDEADPDWACEEVFEPEQRQLDIPLAYSGENWEQCLENMKSALSGYLQTNEPGAKVLKQAQGVGIGFVDGDLEVLTKL